MKHLLTISSLLIVGFITITPAYSDDSSVNYKPSYNYQQKSAFDRNMNNAQQVYQRQQQQQQKRYYNQYKDPSTTHDGRIKSGQNSSIGGSINPPSVNYRQSTD